MKSIFLFLQGLFFVMVAFFIDTGLFLLWSQPILYSVSYTLIFLILSWHNSWFYSWPHLWHYSWIYYFFMLVAGLMLLLELFLYNGCQLSYSFWYLLPIFSFAFFAHSFCYNNRLLFITVSIGVLFSHFLLVENREYDFSHINSYTYAKIIANIILIIFFSLKLHYQSGRDNRCLG